MRFNNVNLCLISLAFWQNLSTSLIDKAQQAQNQFVIVTEDPYD